MRNALIDGWLKMESRGLSAPRDRIEALEMLLLRISRKKLIRQEHITISKQLYSRDFMNGESSMVLRFLVWLG